MGWLDNVKAAVKQVFDEYEKKPEEKEVSKEGEKNEPNDAVRIYESAKKQEEMLNGDGESSISDDTFTNVKWGTPNPITVENLSKGTKQITARGLCEFKIVDREKFAEKFNYDFSKYDENDILALVNIYIVQELGAFLRTFPINGDSNFMLVAMGMNFSNRIKSDQSDTGIEFTAVSVLDIKDS